MEYRIWQLQLWSNDVSVLLNKATPMLYAQASPAMLESETTAPLVTLDVRGNRELWQLLRFRGKQLLPD